MKKVEFEKVVVKMDVYDKENAYSHIMDYSWEGERLMNAYNLVKDELENRRIKDEYNDDLLTRYFEDRELEIMLEILSKRVIEDLESQKEELESIIGKMSQYRIFIGGACDVEIISTNKEKALKINNKINKILNNKDIDMDELNEYLCGELMDEKDVMILEDESNDLSSYYHTIASYEI